MTGMYLKKKKYAKWNNRKEKRNLLCWICFVPNELVPGLILHCVDAERQKAHQTWCYGTAEKWQYLSFWKCGEEQAVNSKGLRRSTQEKFRWPFSFLTYLGTSKKLLVRFMKSWWGWATVSAKQAQPLPQIIALCHQFYRQYKAPLMLVTNLF